MFPLTFRHLMPSFAYSTRHLNFSILNHCLLNGLKQTFPYLYGSIFDKLTLAVCVCFYFLIKLRTSGVNDFPKNCLFHSNSVQTIITYT